MAVGTTTTVDVTYKYTIYATIAYNDNSIYSIGQQSWNIHYAGSLVQPVAGGFGFVPAAGNGNNGGAAFGAGIRNNTDPAAIGQPFAGTPPKPTFSIGANAGWR